MTRIIGVVSGKGGVGKTTVVTNLGTVLAKRGNKVTVVDCNVTTSHLLMHFGRVSYPKTLNDVLRGTSSIKEATYLSYTGVNVVPASLNLSDLIGVDITLLGEKIKNLFEDQDFVILDGAPGFGKEAVSGMMACSEAIMVSTPYLPDITDIVRGKALLQDLGIKVSGLVLNKVTGKSFELKEEEICELTELPVIAKIPFDFKVLESLGLKIPLTFYDRKSKVAREFHKLASFITQEKYEDRNILSRLGKLFSKWS
ncbi:MAG: P-loop NTPase [Candidatus Aenigmatarchaeota archaeon]